MTAMAGKLRFIASFPAFSIEGISAMMQRYDLLRPLSRIRSRPHPNPHH
jgi:hypothetical protein